LHEPILDLALNGEQRAIGRLISYVENNGKEATEIMKKIYRRTGKAHVIGLTGSPGAGKSTMIACLINLFKAENKKVAVIAIDPTSPFTGGSILGDRVRMQEHVLNPNVFIRSMATRSYLGGISKETKNAVLILDACGYDVVIIETVGVGQTEIDIVKIADTVCLVLAPNMGDDVQIMKAGVMEIADVFIVNKSDLDGSTKMASILHGMLNILEKRTWNPKVSLVSSLNNTGFEEVKKIFLEHQKFIKTTKSGKEKRYIRQKEEIKLIFNEMLKTLIESNFKERINNEIIEDIINRKIDPYSVAETLINEIIK
jgi:LAO/AO transport system kinase